MKRVKFKSLICAVASLVVAATVTAAPVFANSGPPYEEGITPTGILSVHENSVLQVLSEKLTFKLGTPLYELQDGEQYDSTVTAEYEFYNPTDETVKTTMAFPISTGYYYGTGNGVTDVKPTVTVNGESVEYSVRHTYGIYNDFSEDVLKIRDGYITTDFFSPDLPVTEYIFKANLPDDDRAEFRVKMPQSDSTRYFGNSDDGVYFSYAAYDGYKFYIYVLGEDIDISSLGWTAYRYNNNLGRMVAVDGSVSFVKKSEPITFKEYVLKSYDSMGDISEMDWYNAMFEFIDKDALLAGSGERPDYYSFTEWYVYETTVAPKSGFTNAVTAVMYPTVYYYYSPYVYEYNYYLSPANGWASFENLTVEIETSLYMQENDLYDPSDAENSVFVKTDAGYAASFTGLPSGELQFKMCSAETPSASSAESLGIGEGIGLIFLIVFSVIIGAALIAGLSVLIVFLVKRGRRKKRLAQSAAAQAEAQTVENATVADDGGGAVLSLPEEDGVKGAPETAEEKPFYCAYCGKQINRSAAFCRFCGKAVYKNNVAPNPSHTRSAPESGVKRINGLGIAGFIVAIISVLFVELEALVFIFSAVGFGLSLAGVLLKKKYRGVYGLAIAGLVISSVMLLIAIVCMPFYMMGITW